MNGMMMKNERYLARHAEVLDDLEVADEVAKKADVDVDALGEDALVDFLGEGEKGSRERKGEMRGGVKGRKNERK